MHRQYIGALVFTILFSSCLRRLSKASALDFIHSRLFSKEDGKEK